MVTATSNQLAASTALPRNTPSTPYTWLSQPPLTPPRKAPRNWEVEKAPMAVPLWAAGASLATREGRLASSRLKAAKNRISMMIISTRVWCQNTRPRQDRPSTVIAPTSTCFMRRFFSASMIKGRMVTTDTNKTGR